MAPLIGMKVVPAFVESSHCTVGAGEPVAAAVKLAVPPAATVWLGIGCHHGSRGHREG